MFLCSTHTLRSEGARPLMKKVLTALTAGFTLLLFVAPAYAATAAPAYFEEPPWFETVQAPTAV